MDATSPVPRRTARRRVRRAAAVLAAALPALLATASPLAAQEAPRPLEVDDLFRIRAVGNPRVSPDGAWVAYTVATTSLEDDRTTTRIWMAPTAGGDPLPMTMESGSASSPAWSPDGRWLSFTASRGDSAQSQVWLLDRRGGEAQQLTEVEGGVGSFAWSPDATRLLLTVRDPEPKDSTRRRGAAEEPWVIDRLQFKRDGQGYLTGDRRTHLYVFDVAGRKPTQLTAGRWDESAPAWSPDGRWVAFASNRSDDPDANSNTDLWVVPSDAEKVESPRRLTDYQGGDGNPAWSPDGRWIAYLTGTHEPRFDMYATRRLAIIPFDPARGDVPERRVLAETLDRNVSNPDFTPDGTGVLVGLEDEGTRQVARVDLASGEVTRLIGGEVSTGAWHAGPDGLLAAVIDEPHLPAEVFLARGLDAPARPTRLTHVNDSLIAALRLGEVTNIRAASRDGTPVEGWVVTPPDYQEGQRYPTILRIHGGPNGQYDVGFNFEAQLLAANGYVVLFTNPRGSSGYGQDFGMALWQRWGIPDFEDVMAAVDHTIERGWADPERLGVGGWSYGGILTNYVITKTDRFKGAITGASMALLVANFGHDHYQLSNEREWGLPWESRELWEMLSPFNAVENVTTPTLVMGGEQDWNVPIQNSEQLYQALRRRGVPSELVVYPGQPHGLRVPSYNKDRLERYLAWYDRWVKGGGKAVVSDGGR
jgi:dipeptidyl aminopeptidase/acylaminoacyl peptidase